MLEKLEFILEFEPDPEDIKFLGDQLDQHSNLKAGKPGFQPIAYFVRDETNEIVAGISGYINWTWLQIDLFWISSDCRGKGLGSKLLILFETNAIKRGCTHSHLDTFSFQARPFYERHGYEVFAVLQDYPPGHQRFYLQKQLAAINKI